MFALAVDEHQRLIGAEAAQRCRVDKVSAICARLPRRIKRRQNELQGLGEIEMAALPSCFGKRNEIDRNRGVGRRSVGTTPTHNIDFVDDYCVGLSRSGDRHRLR